MEILIFRYSDLVVGAPFHTSQEKNKIRVGGAVYIYIGNGTMVSGEIFFLDIKFCALFNQLIWEVFTFVDPALCMYMDTQFYLKSRKEGRAGEGKL